MVSGGFIPPRVLVWRRPLGFVTLGVAGHLAVGPADLGKVVSVDVSDWIHTNGLTVSSPQADSSSRGLQLDQLRAALHDAVKPGNA
jgi:hypothetical protein